MLLIVSRMLAMALRAVRMKDGNQGKTIHEKASVNENKTCIIFRIQVDAYSQSS
jgi:hypothetical protein